MSTVIAAIDDSAAARPVLATAQAVAALWDAHVEALHVAEDDGHTAAAPPTPQTCRCASNQATSPLVSWKRRPIPAWSRS